MSNWKPMVEAASAGLLAMAAVELLQRHSTQQQCRHLAAAAGLAGVYAWLVPPAARGLRSGAGFSQLRLVRSLPVTHSLSPAHWVLWGGFMGALLRAAGHAGILE